MTRLADDLAPGIAAHEEFDRQQQTIIDDQAARILELEQDLVEPPVTPGTNWYLGMATEPAKWAERVAQVGTVNGRRRFRSTWSVSGLVGLAEECHGVGCLPYVSAKMSPSTWAQVAAGALDADAEKLGQQLAALGYAVRFTSHHEPRPATVAELVDWGKALTRLFTRMRAGAGAEGSKRLILGGTDNGFMWGEKWQGGVSKADLDTYYTDAFLGACDVMGADTYDGATDKPGSGEAAWIKMRNMGAYFDARGFQGVNDPGWRYDIGEWNFVAPGDCDETWTFLTSPDGAHFNNLNLFNSAANNRTDLPAELGGSWVLVPGSERMAAYKRMLRNAGIQ